LSGVHNAAVSLLCYNHALLELLQEYGIGQGKKARNHEELCNQ
jgi:hypothetical protein